MQVLRLIHHVLGQKAMELLDASLGEVSSDTEVRATGAASMTLTMRAGATYHGHDEIAYRDVLYIRTNLNYLSQRLMPQNQVLRALRGCAVLKGGDLSIGAADTHLEDPELDLI
jgi:hypothetical protein